MVHCQNDGLERELVNAALLLLLLTSSQAVAVYLLLSKAVLTAISTWAVRGLLLRVISATSTCATWESQIILLWITCPLRITRGQPVPLQKRQTFLYWHFFSPPARTSDSVPLPGPRTRAELRRWIPASGTWADKVWLKMRGKRRLKASRWSGISGNSFFVLLHLPQFICKLCSWAKSPTVAT